MYAIGIPDHECGTCWYDFEQQYFHPELKSTCLLPTEKIVDLILKNEFEVMVKSLIETGTENVEWIRDSIHIYELSEIVFDDNFVERFDSEFVRSANS